MSRTRVSAAAHSLNTMPDPGTYPRNRWQMKRRLRAWLRHSLADQEKVADMARELVIDLRAELPRIDARAAAGAALTAAVLVSVVTQAPKPSPVYAFGVSAAVLLTIALLLFLAVLFPTITVARHPSAVHAKERA